MIRILLISLLSRPQKFKLVSEHVMEFSHLAGANSQGCDAMLNRVMPKDNIALAAVFETREGAYEPTVSAEIAAAQKIMVATAHIHWDPEFCDVKMVQTLMLVDQLQRLRKDQPRTQLLLCGDFNSLPGKHCYILKCVSVMCVWYILSGTE